MSILARLLSPPSVDGILADFTKTASKLDALVVKNDDACNAHLETIDVLENQIGKLSAEARRAAAARDKIRALVSA